MKRTLAMMVAALLTLSGVGAALAVPPEGKGPGPNDKNNHGLCTAYFNGKKKGHDDGSPGPFAELEEEAADAYEGDEADPIERKVFDYCEGSIGGNPANGRYPGLFPPEE